MSYTLVILEPPVPADDVDAWNHLAEVTGREPSGEVPAVYHTLIDQLTAKYPCLSELGEDQVDQCVWSDGPLRNNATPLFTMLGISTTRVMEVLPFVVQTANGLGLSVFDQQAGQIHRPIAQSAPAPPPARTAATTPRAASAANAPAYVPTLHNGKPIPDDMEFFGNPQEIGPIGSQSSTLRKSTEPRSFLMRLIPYSAAGLTVAALGLAWSWAIIQPPAQPGDVIIACFPLLMVPLGGWLTWWLMDSTNFRHTSSYVGQLGIHDSRIKKERGNLDKEYTFLFATAAHLFSKTTHVSVNGVYSGTQYEFVWMDGSGKVVRQLKGSYHRERILKKIDDPYYFAAAAETAWSIAILDKMQEQLDRDGYVEFKVNSADAIRVGKGFIELSFRGNTQRIGVEEIGKLTLGGGHFNLRHKDAKWWGGQGKFYFDYGKMSNARVFLLALKRLCGLEFN